MNVRMASFMRSILGVARSATRFFAREAAEVRCAAVISSGTAEPM